MTREHPNRDLIALGIRQPWAELIIRGIKTIEVRSSNVNQRGPIYIYASKKLADQPAAILAAETLDCDVESLPRGKLVGTVELVDSNFCKQADSTAACVPWSLMRGKHSWKLANPQRLPQPMAVRFLPYGIWFYPFKRAGKGRNQLNDQ
jgi:hypothetical protein